MRIVATDRCKPGAILGRPLYNAQGRKLLQEGAELTSAMLEKIKRLGIAYLYVKDAFSSDIEINEAIPIEIRLEAMRTLGSIFKEARKRTQGRGPFSPVVNINDICSVFHKLLAAVKENRQTISLLSEFFIHNNYTFSHSVNVAIYAIAASLKHGYKDRQLQEIGVGALLHDIGKLFIPDEILNKPNRLTEEELKVIQLHPGYGYDLLKGMFEISYSSAHCAFQHHERWNGTGYPRRLKGEEIHPYARLIAVCDVFDAMTTHRAYRRAILPNEAMNWICAQASVLFEEGAVDAFQRTISPYPVGLTVRLNSGETAIVIAANESAPERPLIRIIKEPNGEMLTRGRELDLNQRPELSIVDCHPLL